MTVLEQRQPVTLKAAERERKIAVMEAEKLAQVARTNAEADLVKAQSSVAIANVSRQTFLARSREETDAAFYGKLKEAEANVHRLTPEFLELERGRLLARNMEIHWGNMVPSAIASDDEAWTAADVVSASLRQLR